MPSEWSQVKRAIVPSERSYCAILQFVQALRLMQHNEVTFESYAKHLAHSVSHKYDFRPKLLNTYSITT